MTTHQAIFFFFNSANKSNMTQNNFCLSTEHCLVKHTSNNTYKYIDLCIHIHRQKLLGKKVTSKIKTTLPTHIPQKNTQRHTYTEEKITVSETPKPLWCVHMWRAHTQWQKTYQISKRGKAD